MNFAFVCKSEVKLRWRDWIFLGGYLPCLSINYVAMSKDMEKKITTTVLKLNVHMKLETMPVNNEDALL